MPRGPFAFHEVVRLGACWKWNLSVGLSGAFCFCPGLFVGLSKGFCFCEACSPLPMGEGPGVRSGLSGAFCFL